jgi:hypothetical protein
MQQSEVHEHTIETTVFKWQILCCASPRLNRISETFFSQSRSPFRRNQFLWEARRIVSSRLRRSRGPQATSKTNIFMETLASAKSEGMNCRVSGHHTESYLSATRCQPSCSNRAKSSSISDVNCRAGAPAYQCSRQPKRLPYNLTREEIRFVLLLRELQVCFAQ